MTALGTETNLLWSRVDDDGFLSSAPPWQRQASELHLSSRAYESLFSPLSFHRKKTLSRLLDFILFDPIRIPSNNSSQYTVQ
ncbi:hypothetical protein BOTNAR_0204g00130 [Botryotinia narcissicola]|uniref:Uncharacterized protein n=1 Tax=Botryotinia narcissicola TaxID=278944 RepID=A0A4Z1I6L8_9HELO|nr:hypothetical protein BOTNAR_0204g00130 [Botryotinia narcissicola]